MIKTLKLSLRYTIIFNNDFTIDYIYIHVVLLLTDLFYYLHLNNNFKTCLSKMSEYVKHLFLAAV